MKVFFFVILFCLFSNGITCNCDSLVCIPSDSEQEGVKGASDLSSVLSTEPCTSEQAHHDQAGKINSFVLYIANSEVSV